jgi:hypothetical protein
LYFGTLLRELVLHSDQNALIVPYCITNGKDLMTLCAKGEQEQASAPKTRWRSHPATEILFAWSGFVWAAPIVSILAIFVSETHSQNFSIVQILILYFSKFVVLFALSWFFVPFSLIGVKLAEDRLTEFFYNFYRSFWGTLILIHVLRFLMARMIADMYFTGLTGPGIGPNLDGPCLLLVQPELKLECSELTSIKLSNMIVTAFFSLILFAFDAVRINMRTRT